MVLAWFGTRTNSAPYEALKSRGLELISDDDLRIDLIRYYEDVFPLVENAYLNDRTLVLDEARPYYLENFRQELDTNGASSWTPLDYEALRPTDPSLAEAFFQMFPRPGQERTIRTLTATDGIQVGVLMYSVLRNLENVYLQSREGVIDESVLLTYGFADPRFTTDAFRQYWVGEAPTFDTAFVRVFESIQGPR